jgi:pyruvate/2-oxoglutarate dehydrogenase complex dihydrolipoamide dehydrogenase (E3) component
MMKPDICIIGAGSGGLSVAAAARAFGASVVLIEKHKMGGDCLNYGCVPSKALIACAKQAQTMREATPFGIQPVEPIIDFKSVMKHIKSVIGEIAPHDSVERFTKMGAHVIEAEAKFIDKDTVIAGDTIIKARRYVIATGSKPFIPPISGLDTVDYLTNETLFEQNSLSQHLIIIGGGPIGVEMAQAHKRLGSHVSVIQSSRILNQDDREMTAIILQSLISEGIDLYEETTVIRVEKKDNVISVYVRTPTGDSCIEGDRLLIAAGRVANTQGLGLDKAGIDDTKKGITINKGLRTSNHKVYAIGDVAGSLQFTHMAGYQAGLVIRSILFRLPIRENKTLIPHVTFSQPELAHIGLQEKDFVHKKHEIRVLRWSFSDNDRARCENKTQGMIKIIASSKGRILGVSIVGQGAGEMINLWSLALSKRLNVRDIASFVAPYPTMSEISKRAAISFYAEFPKKSIVRRIISWLKIVG